MTIRRTLRAATAFLMAVVVTAFLASVVQTQFNLAALIELGADIPLLLRASTTLLDVIHFGPVMAAITAAAFLPAFAAAAVLAHRLPSHRLIIYAVAGAVGLWAAFFVMGFVTPMPNLIAALRSPAGLTAMVLTGLLGGAVFASRNPTRRRPSV